MPPPPRPTLCRESPVPPYVAGPARGARGPGRGDLATRYRYGARRFLRALARRGIQDPDCSVQYGVLI
jgi:hypothetical protein